MKTGVERGCCCVNHRRSLLDFIPSQRSRLRWCAERVRALNAPWQCSRLTKRAACCERREKRGRSGFLILNNWNMIRNLLGSERFPAIPLSVWGVRERPKSHIDLGQSSPADKLRRCQAAALMIRRAKAGHSFRMNQLDPADVHRVFILEPIKRASHTKTPWNCLFLLLYSIHYTYTLYVKYTI